MRALQGGKWVAFSSADGIQLELKQRGLGILRSKLDWAGRLDQELLDKINRPLPPEDRHASLAELRNRLLYKVEGMAELLWRMGLIQEEEMYDIFGQCGLLAEDD